jgi:hypothetical protein
MTMIAWLGSPRKMLGQIVPGQFDQDLFTVQVLVNEVLRARGLPEIRDDGVLDQATCDRLFQIATGTFGTPDSQLADLVLAHPELNNLCRGLAPLPPPPPPAPEPPPGEFEQCFINFGDTSEAIRSIQRRVNTELSARGFVPIPEDGAWNSVTCGALYFLTLVHGVPAEGASSPFNIPECPGGTQVPVECPDRVTPQRAGAPATAAGGGVSPLAVVGLIAAALGAAYYVTQT